MSSKLNGVFSRHSPDYFRCISSLHLGSQQSVWGSQSVRRNTELAAYKRGKGGRSSFSGQVVTVFGATGFIGRHIVNRLAKIGCQIIIPYRGDIYYVEKMKVSGDLGQILFLVGCPYHLRDEESLVKAMRHSNCVVNLAAANYPTKNFSMADVNIDGAARIARLARECGVEKLLHFSSLNVSYNPPSFYKKTGSEFLRTKAYGEDVVREEFPNAIIFRPSDVFGYNDFFIQYYTAHWRRSKSFKFWTEIKTMSMWRHGVRTTKLPVYINNVSSGVARALRSPDAIGKTYDIVGPHRYRLDDLLDYMYVLLRRPPLITREIYPLFRLKVWLIYQIPTKLRLWPDKLEREFLSDTVTGKPTLEDLGVELTTIEDTFPHLLRPLRQYNYYHAALGEFPDPEPPTRIDEAVVQKDNVLDKLHDTGTLRRFEQLGFTLDAPKI